MITFYLNNKKVTYDGDPEKTLLKYLRLEQHITSVKDGCSGQAACGACTVEINGKAKLSCVTKMRTLEDTRIYTPEGFPEYVLDTIAKAFVNKGAVQCGFCISGFVMSTLSLLKNHSTPVTTDQIKKSMGGNLCRCTGYSRIIKAIQELSNNEKVIQKINKDWRNEFSR